MAKSVFEEILKQREIRNEKILAMFRLAFISFSGLMDCLSYLNLIDFTAITPTATTLLLDLVFILFAAAILLTVLYLRYYEALKYVTITLDYVFIGMMLTFDPTVPKADPLIYWIAMVASIFIFTYNLLRFSKTGTLYSAALSMILFLAVSVTAAGGDSIDFLPMFMGLVMVLAVGYSITNSNFNMMQEANAKKMMERFLPPQLIDELYTDKASLEPGGRNQEVTILFSDIRSFTALAESLSPAEVVALLNDYLSTMTEIIFSFQGTIDKFIGDSIMTVFGAPIRADDDAERAILSAIAMNHAVESVNQRHRELRRRLEIGIGIHTGNVIFGSIGSEKRLDYTVIGDNVNLSSRIEGLTKHYRCPILISQATMDKMGLSAAGRRFLIREVDTVLVKGKSKAIRIFEVMGPADDRQSGSLSALKARFEIGLALYKNRKFEDAMKQFRMSDSDGLSRLYAERCQDFMANPPADSWDGSHIMTEK